MGLAISKQLVELMGGYIAVESQVDSGSTFWLTLPLPSDPRPREVFAPVTELKDLRVLIDDRNEASRRVLHEQITSWGMRNGSFGSADEVFSAILDAGDRADPFQLK